MRTFLKDCKWGRFVLLQGDMVSQYADVYGEWCEHEVSLFAKILRSNSNVVEIGSHVGLHTVPLSKLADKGKVLCFEPQRLLYQILCANCAINNRVNVFAHHLALGNSSGVIEIACTDYSTPWNYGSFSIDRGFNTEGVFRGAEWRESVGIAKLDQVHLTTTLDSVALLKIDVEGLEIDVLNGASGLISKHKPILFVENNKEQNGDELIAKIREFGYECYWYCAERFRPDNYNSISWKLPGADVNMVCFPKDKQADTRGLMKVGEFADLRKGAVPLIRG